MSSFGGAPPEQIIHPHPVASHKACVNGREGVCVHIFRAPPRSMKFMEVLFSGVGRCGNAQDMGEALFLLTVTFFVAYGLLRC